MYVGGTIKMPRPQLVTRTIKSTKVVALVCDTANYTTEQREFTLPRVYPDTDAMLKVLAKKYTTETLKVVKVLSYEVCEALYGMSEEKFIENAQILPPRKVNE